MNRPITVGLSDLNDIKIAFSGVFAGDNIACTASYDRSPVNAGEYEATITLDTGYPANNYNLINPVIEFVIALMWLKAIPCIGSITPLMWTLKLLWLKIPTMNGAAASI